MPPKWPVVATFAVMFLVINLTYFFLYGGAFALMKITKSADSVACPWIFPEAGAAWSGVRFAAFNSSPAATHAVDVTGYVERGIESLRCHELYLANLGTGAADPGESLLSNAASAGERFGVLHAVAFELVMF